MTDTRTALEEAAVIIWGEETRSVVINDPVLFDRMCRFDALLGAEAWTSAAEMLVLPGWDSISIRRTDDGLWHVQLAGNDAHLMAEDPDEFYVEVEDFAEQWDAIRAACIKAKGNTNGR